MCGGQVYIEQLSNFKKGLINFVIVIKDKVTILFYLFICEEMRILMKTWTF